ncbi:hypothetical protein ILUMI_21653 [Ignelater luminosus]|uniref:SCP domain-containing protein n=1 Tax=Ignelater luminosus TaxID=2038154 RepID=A0A8K0CH99_IGNLU|nr:hypothetical protein ILUMI_21653 [Ignelater luminosus]
MFKCLIILTVHIFLANSTSEIGPDVNYCDFPCGSHMHTICKLKHRCEVSSKCKRFQNSPFSDSEKQKIIQTHNNFRNLIALGEGCKSMEGKWFPPAASMRELVWDGELEFQAQCWANQCVMEHDICRRKYDGQYAGQILAWVRHKSVFSALRAFFDECKNTSLANIDSYGTGKEWGGHFAQMIYWNTTQVGCARVIYEFEDRSSERVMFVCNYAWAGSRVGEPIYIRGSPASRCPAHSKPHMDLKGLCTTNPSKSKVPNICKFAKDKKKCIPYLSMVKSVRRSYWTPDYDVYGQPVNFCDEKYRCWQGIHTICQANHNCRRKPHCLDDSELTQKEKRDILNRHNELRNTVALGKLKQIQGYQLTFPQASNMQELVWDEELEFFAQCLANQGIYKHDNCTIKTDGTPFGQNIASGYGYTIMDFVNAWYAEYENLNQLSSVLEPTEYPYQTGHFTQLVYAESMYIGCAKSRFWSNNKVDTFLVCNYGPAGNKKYQPMYIKGKPCASCQGRCHRIYKGLCKTQPSRSKPPNICKPYDYDCGPILKEPGLKDYYHHKWYARIKKSKKNETQKFVRASAVLKKNSFVLMGFVGCITVTYNFLL